MEEAGTVKQYNCSKSESTQLQKGNSLVSGGVLLSKLHKRHPTVPQYGRPGTSRYYRIQLPHRHICENAEIMIRRIKQNLSRL